jgi:hypothetical protein
VLENLCAGKLVPSGRRNSRKRLLQLLDHILKVIDRVQQNAPGLFGLFNASALSSNVSRISRTMNLAGVSPEPALAAPVSGWKYSAR